jgi:capsular polysaccharide transport system permease protein
MMPQVPFTLFLVTGMIPFFLFRTIISSLMNSAEANKALFAYKPVKPFDTYISRTLLEVLIYSTIFVIILIGLGWLFGFDIMIAHPLELLMNTGLIIVMAFGIGIGCSVLAYKLPLIKLFVKVFLTVLYFISAIMYPLWVLPSKYMEWLLYNPLLHSIELFRESFFSYYPRIDGISMTFPIMVTITTLFLSLWFYQKYKFQLAASS